MVSKARRLAQGAILAALYAVLTHFQNLLFPGSATWAIQLRLSEVLCVFAFFTPAAAVGLSIGCLIFNVIFSAALPLDFVVGPLATYLAARGMWRNRCRPWPALFLPAVWNGLLVGGELALYIGGGFWVNAVYVFLGEALVMLTLGSFLYAGIKARKLDRLLFG